MGKWGWGAAAFVVAVSSACTREQPYDKPLTTVKITTVAKEAAQSGGRYSASLEPFARVDLAFKVGGYVREILQVKDQDGKPRTVQEGDSVPKDNVLARVREGDYLQKVAGAKAQLAEATAQREQAQLDLDRASKLVATQTVAQAQLDGARAQLDAASARVEAAKAQLAEAEMASADTALRSPIAGVVFKRAIEVGSLVSPGSVGFSIADTRSVKAVFGVPDVVVEKLRLGSQLVITTETAPGTEFPGRITRISPSADPKSRVFEVETTIPNDKQQLRVGMIGALKVPEGSSAAAAAVVPLNAVVRSPKDPAQFAVYVVTAEGGAETAHVREVALGDPVGNRVLVTGGLTSGDRVVVRGASIVADGERVQVIP